MKKCFRCGVPEPVLKMFKHSDGQQHLTCADCIETLTDMSGEIQLRVTQMRAAMQENEMAKTVERYEEDIERADEVLRELAERHRQFMAQYQ